MARYRFDQIAINSTDKRKPEDKDQADYIGLEHLDSGSLKVTRWGSKVPLKGEKLVMKKGDVLFGKRNAYLRRAAISPHDGLFSAHGMVLRPKTEIVDSEFFPFFIGSDYFFDRAIKISVGSLSPTVNWRDLKKEEFDLPSIPEQKKLTKVLKAISITKYAYEDLVRQTDELVKSQFIEMFGCCKQSKLEKMATIVMGQSPSSDSYNTDGDGVEFHQGSGEFTEKYVAQGMYCTKPTRMAKADDVLMSVRAPVGTVNITRNDCCIGRGLAAIRSNRAPELNEFLLYAFRAKADEFNAMGHGSTILSINKNELHDLMMPDATVDQQLRFVEVAGQSDKSKFELQYVKRNVKEMITCSQKKIQLNR